MIYDYPGVVAEVHDGDTVRVCLDLGFGLYQVINLRIRDLHCPELHGSDRVQGEAARDYAKGLLPVFSSVRVRTYRTAGGHAVKSFDRYIADLTLADGRDFASLMVAAGHGTCGSALDGTGPTEGAVGEGDADGKSADVRRHPREVDTSAVDFTRTDGAAPVFGRFFADG